MSALEAETLGAAEAAPTPEAAPASEPLAAEQVAGEAADATAPVAPAAPTAPTEPEFDPYMMQAELEQVRGQYDQLVGYLQSLAAGGSPSGAVQQADAAVPQFTDEFGNFDAAAFTQYQAARDQQLLGQIGQMFAPLAQTFEQQQALERQAVGEENVKDMIGDDVARNGEFASKPEVDAIARERVRQRAEVIFDDYAQRFGPTARAAEFAIRQAAQEEREYLRSIGVEANTRQANQLATLAGAAADAGNGATGGVPGAPSFASPKDVLEHYSGQARRLLAEGQ